MTGFILLPSLCLSYVSLLMDLIVSLVALTFSGPKIQRVFTLIFWPLHKLCLVICFWNKETDRASNWVWIEELMLYAFQQVKNMGFCF